MKTTSKTKFVFKQGTFLVTTPIFAYKYYANLNSLNHLSNTPRTGKPTS